MLTNQKPNGQTEGQMFCLSLPLTLYSHQLLCLPQPSDLGFTFRLLTFLIVMNDDHEDLLI